MLGVTQLNIPQHHFVVPHPQGEGKDKLQNRRLLLSAFSYELEAKHKVHNACTILRK